MRKILLSLLVLSCFSFGSSAQTDARAKTILAQVSKKYRSYNVVKANFTFTLDNLQAKTKETRQGTLFVKANANKYRVIMDGRELISDGKSQWSYLKEDKEVQLTSVDNSGDALNPAKIFTMYEKGFKYLYTGETKIGAKTYQNIDLSPLDAKTSFFKIKLSIDKAAKQLSSAVILDKNGNRYTYSINSFIPNVKIPETTFTFDTKKYPGVEVVDLR